jgi:hypothetical protein
MSEGGNSRRIYLCRGHDDIAFYARSSFGNTIDAVQRRFFGDDGLSLRRYAFELEPGDDRCHQNSILFASEDSIIVLTYNLFDEMDVGWRSVPINRSERQPLVRSLIDGQMSVHSELDGKCYNFRPEGPKVIVIDTSRSFGVRQPSIEQYLDIIRSNGGIAQVVEENTGAAIRFSPEASYWKTRRKTDDDDPHSYA